MQERADAFAGNPMLDLSKCFEFYT